MHWTQKRAVWIGTVIFAYLFSSIIWSGMTLSPSLVPSTLYYAPTGLLRLLGIPVYVIPDPRPAIIESMLPWIHAAFWPGLILVLVCLHKASSKTTRVLYFSFVALLLLNIAGCVAVAGF